jgi:hypothetical protein
MYLILDGGEVWDFDLTLMSGVLETLDRQWVSLSDVSVGCPDPDGFGIYDEMEYLAGLGFVVCQRYLSATLCCNGISKEQALNLPPMHASGQSVASIVNAGANCWKHADEAEPLRPTTSRVIEAVGVKLDFYPCQHLLLALVGDDNPPFVSLSACLLKWRASVIDLHLNIMP